MPSPRCLTSELVTHVAGRKRNPRGAAKPSTPSRTLPSPTNAKQLQLRRPLAPVLSANLNAEDSESCRPQAMPCQVTSKSEWHGSDHARNGQYVRTYAHALNTEQRTPLHSVTHPNVSRANTHYRSTDVGFVGTAASSPFQLPALRIRTLCSKLS